MKGCRENFFQKVVPAVTPMYNRIFLIVLDSFGTGELPDADLYGDVGSNTLASIAKSKYFHAPNLTRLGLFGESEIAAHGKMGEKSFGKETIVGHFEIAGAIVDTPLPYYPDGFPAEIIEEFSRITGRGVLCNKPYSGTEVLTDYGEEHMRTGELIVYTSADSVFQIAAHEDIVPTDELYDICKKARAMLCGKHAVGRVIARPFVGEPGNFTRSAGRHDYSLLPPKTTMLDILKENRLDVIGVGKISDIFSGRGITRSIPTKSNAHGLEVTSGLSVENFRGLAFVNLVDFDSVYGHRNDVDGYARAVSEFDAWLGDFMETMGRDDLLIVTADHGCDPATPSTDHSREYVPLLVYGKEVKPCSLGVRECFADIAATVLDIFGSHERLDGESFYGKIH